MDTSQGVTAYRPEYRLFDSRAVGLVAFFCGPLAGAVLIGLNYARLRKDGKGVLAVVLGLTATALVLLTRWNLQSPLAPLVSDALAVLFIICTWQIAKNIQGRTVAEHIAHGGQLAAQSTAFFIGIATLAGLVVVTVAALYQNPNHKMVIIGTKDQVFYSGIMATKNEAAALGNALKSNEYFQDRGSSVVLTKGFGSTTISFVVQDGIWDQAGMLSQFEELAREVAPAVGGLPVRVRLLDSQMDVEETSTVGEVKFDGVDGVYYEGSATKSQAQAVGQRLKAMGFFSGKGANVILIRHPDGTTLAFVLKHGWDNPKMVSSFEAIAREVAPAVGGLPVNLQLVSTQIQLEKGEVIQ